ncbi:MAG TPA: 30S ribosomal protein S6 [Armatimonadota bacterium]|nr:30S ribosomal protein S6 [Armatimonadota bacterium]
MVRPYEALYIVHPDLSDEEIEAIIEKYKQVVAEQGGEVESTNRWEKRRLAYDVKGQREGIYVLMTFKSEAKAAAELTRLLKIGDNVLRHIIVRLDEE